MRKTAIISILAFVLFITNSCKKIEEYPIEPHIEFVDFIKLYNESLGVFDKAILKISYTDGDGDIGLTEADTLPPYDFNLFIDYFELRNGEFVLVEDLFPPLHGRIPMLTPNGIHKAIKGEIEDLLDLNYFSNIDTVKYQVYIMDRELHKSNVVETPPIYIK